MSLPMVITPEQQALLSEVSRPCGQEVVLAHLMRLAAHKKVTGEAWQMEIVANDYADYMAEKEPKEYEVYDAIDWFITKDKSPFLPPVSRILAALESAMKHGFVRDQDLTQEEIK